MSIEHSPARQKETATNVKSSILDEYISPEHLAAELHISTRTLDRWHALREGPPRTKLGKRILYRRESVAAWLRSREIEAA